MKADASPGKSLETHQKPTRKIVYSFVLVLGLVGLVPLGVVANKLIDISREALVTSQQDAQLQVAASMVRQLDASVEGMREEMARLAEGIGVTLGAQGGDRGWQGAAQRLIDRVVGAGLILVRYVPRSGKPLEAHRSGFSGSPEVEKAIEDGLRSALEGSATVSAPIPLRTTFGRGALLSVTVPVGPQGRNGALTGLVDFAKLWDPLAGGRRAVYTLYALDRSGRLFAAQDEDGILGRSDYRAFGVVQEFGEAGGRSARTTEFTLDLDGQPLDYLASFNTTALGWGIFVQLEKKQAYASVNQMIQTTLIWAGLAMGVALVLAYVMAATVTRPIKTLAAGTEAFARGELDHRVRVTSRNELGALAETFNAMARQIQDYIQRLSAAARLNNELFMGTIKALAEAIDEKDPYTRGHSERVNQYAVLLAKQMGLGRQEVREVHISSLFHDIGKIGIEDTILRKPAVLTDEEYNIMKRHPEKGAQMLSKIKAMRDIIPGIRFHHERWDGSGYPTGLKAEQIPIQARIVAVADAFDAMTTNRPYQKAMSYEMAISRLFELSGRVFDRTVVEAFSAAHQAGTFREPSSKIAEEA